MVLRLVLVLGHDPKRRLKRRGPAFAGLALRAGDLAYLHTHPGEAAEPGVAGGPDVEFMTTFPSPGNYRLFLDFQVDGEVRTAELTVDVEEHR